MCIRDRYNYILYEYTRGEVKKNIYATRLYTHTNCRLQRRRTVKFPPVSERHHNEITHDEEEFCNECNRFTRNITACISLV